MKIVNLIFALLLLSFSVEAVNLRLRKIVKSDVSKVESLNSFFKKIEDRFPSDFLKDKTVYIDVNEYLDDSRDIFISCDDSSRGSVLGSLNQLRSELTGKISLKINRAFVDYISDKKTDKKFNCKHRSIVKTAEATIIHELAHIYDSRSKDLEGKGWALSSSPKYLNISNWKTAFRSSQRLNQRSADEYDHAKNVREHFATNLEYFFLDSSFKCRRPSLYGYMSKVIKADPSASS